MLNKVTMTRVNQPSFGSNLTASIGKQIMKTPTLKDFAGKIEYSNFTMSMTSMLILLYGATIVPRYINATDKYDRREILTRDFLSITSILFAAKAWNKGFSRIFSKASGFVLNKVPNG